MSYDQVKLKGSTVKWVSFSSLSLLNPAHSSTMKIVFPPPGCFCSFSSSRISVFGLSALHVAHSSVFPNKQWMVSWPPFSLTAGPTFSFSINLLIIFSINFFFLVNKMSENCEKCRVECLQRQNRPVKRYDSLLQLWTKLNWTVTVLHNCGRLSVASGSVMCAIDLLTISYEDVLFMLPPPICTSHDSRVGAKTATSDPDEAHGEVWWCAENVCRGFWRFTGLSDTSSDTGCGGLNSAWGSQSRATTERKSRDGLTPRHTQTHSSLKRKRANVKTDVMFLLQHQTSLYDVACLIYSFLVHQRWFLGYQSHCELLWKQQPLFSEVEESSMLQVK